MKIVKYSLIWLACVFFSFTTIFTVNMLYERGGLEGIYYSIVSFENGRSINHQDIEQAAKSQEEWINTFFENSHQEEINWKEIYKQYPVGTVYTMNQMATMMGVGQATIHSLIIGLILGTSIFLLGAMKKRGIIITIIFYLLSVVLLGFLQGIQEIDGKNLKLLDYLVFPDQYITSVTILFGAVILLMILRKKEIANKLNQKLQERKANKNEK